MTHHQSTCVGCRCHATRPARRSAVDTWATPGSLKNGSVERRASSRKKPRSSSCRTSRLTSTPAITLLALDPAHAVDRLGQLRLDGQRALEPCARLAVVLRLLELEAEAPRDERVPVDDEPLEALAIHAVERWNAVRRHELLVVGLDGVQIELGVGADDGQQQATTVRAVDAGERLPLLLARERERASGVRLHERLQAVGLIESGERDVEVRMAQLQLAL